MHGLLEIADSSVNRTLITLGTGLLPLLFHFLFVNMKFSMLRKKERLAPDARDRLERHVLHQLRIADGPTTRVTSSSTNVGESAIPVRRGDEENAVEEETDDAIRPRWVVAQYHLVHMEQVRD